MSLNRATANTHSTSHPPCVIVQSLVALRQTRTGLISVTRPMIVVRYYGYAGLALKSFNESIGGVTIVGPNMMSGPWPHLCVSALVKWRKLQ